MPKTATNRSKTGPSALPVPPATFDTTAQPAFQVEQRPISALIPYDRNARRHDQPQMDDLRRSMQEYGWTIPLLIDEQNGVLAGHALLEHVSARGAAVVIEAAHGCLCYRGVRKERASFITSAMLGVFRTDPELRREFFGAIQLTHTRV